MQKSTTVRLGLTTLMHVYVYSINIINSSVYLDTLFPYKIMHSKRYWHGKENKKWQNEKFSSFLQGISVHLLHVMYIFKHHFNLNSIEIWKWPLPCSDFGDENKTERLLSCSDNSILSTINLSAFLRLTDISYLHKWVFTTSKLTSRC